MTEHQPTDKIKPAMGFTCQCGKWYAGWNEFNAHLMTGGKNG